MGSGHHGLSISKPDNGTHLCFWLMFILYLQETNCLDQCLYFSSGDMWAHTTTFQSIQCQMPNPMFQLKGGATSDEIKPNTPQIPRQKNGCYEDNRVTWRLSPVCLRQESHSFVASVLVDQVCKLVQNASSYHPTLKTNNQPKSPTGSFCTNVWDFLGGNLSEIWWPQTSLKKYWDLWFFCLIHWKKIPKRKCPWEKTN